MTDDRVWRVCQRIDDKPCLNIFGIMARVLHEQEHTGVLGHRFPIYLVRFIGSKRDRWVVPVRGKWCLLEESEPSIIP